MQSISPISQETKFDHRDEDGNTEYHNAVRDNDPNKIRFLNTHHINPNIDTYMEGEKPIQLAVKLDDFDCVDALCEIGASITGFYKNKSLLHDAKSPEMVQKLVDLNIDINNCDINGSTPLLAAFALNRVGYGAYCPMVAHKLIDLGANYTISNDDDITCLHGACKCGDLEFVQLFIESGEFDIEITDCCNMTPLSVAVFFGRVDIIEYLLAINANVNHRDSHNETYLHIIARRDDTTVLNILWELIEWTVDIVGLTPLHIAAQYNNIEFIQWLLPKLSIEQINAQCKRGNTAKFFARDENIIVMIEEATGSSKD